MSKLEVDTIAPQSGTTITVGESGDTVTIPTGVTLDASNATTTLPATVVTTTGSQTLTNKSIDSDNNTITNIVNADIKAGAAIDYSKLNLTGNIALADLSATGTKDATTFLRGDNTFAEVSAGLNLISSGNISGTVASLSLDNIFSSSYRNYRIIISELSTTNDSSNSQVYGRLLKYSDGSELSNNKYDWVRNGMYYSTSTGANVDNTGADNQDYFQMSANNIDSDRAYASNYIIDVLNPFSTNSYTHLCILTSSAKQDNLEFYSRYTWVRFKGNYDQGDYARGLKIYPSGGSLDNGYYRVYGYAD